MSIVIPNMEMPKHCGECMMSQPNDELTYCPILGRWMKNNKLVKTENNHGDCPLVELSQHGDLISKQEIVQKLMNTMCKGCKHTDDCGWCAMAEYRRIVENAPIILEAIKE